MARAYVLAVVSKAGMNYPFPANDYGIDLYVRTIETTERQYFDAGVQIDFQIKSTTRANLTEDAVYYDLEIKTYNDFRQSRRNIPRLLIVFVLPNDETEWLDQTEDQLMLRRCAYWVSLSGAAEVENTKTIRIRIPRENVFSVESLQSLMSRLEKGESL